MTVLYPIHVIMRCVIKGVHCKCTCPYMECLADMPGKMKVAMF